MKKIRLPLWFSILSHALPWFLCLYFAIVTIVDHDLMVVFIARDGFGGAGAVENLTVIILLPGIIAGFYFFLRYRHIMQPQWTAYWLLLWSLASFYFFGEEISWGQWFFQWDTPEYLCQINTQKETNLHNISSWLDQKPRALVELWIVLGGVILPMYSIFKQKQNTINWQYWILPLPSMISAGLFFMIVRLTGWVNDHGVMHDFGISEMRELCTALFLSLFLLSYAVRGDEYAKSKSSAEHQCPDT